MPFSFPLPVMIVLDDFLLTLSCASLILYIFFSFFFLHKICFKTCISTDGSLCCCCLFSTSTGLVYIPLNSFCAYSTTTKGNHKLRIEWMRNRNELNWKTKTNLSHAFHTYTCIYVYTERCSNTQNNRFSIGSELSFLCATFMLLWSFKIIPISVVLL